MNIEDIRVEEINTAILDTEIVMSNLKESENAKAVFNSKKWKPSARYKALQVQLEALQKLRGMRINVLVALTEPGPKDQIAYELATACVKQLKHVTDEQNAIGHVEEVILTYHKDNSKS